MQQKTRTPHHVALNETAYEHARNLIATGRAVLDDRDSWSEHQPTAEAENEFIREQGWREFARWHLGINEDAPLETKARYEFPYGDFQKIHRCATLAAESRAAQYDHADIETAAAHLHGMLDELKRRGS